MRPFFSRPPAAFALPAVTIAAASFVLISSSGCGNKPDDSAATQGAYGEPAATAPAVPAASPAAASAPPLAATIPVDSSTTPPGPMAASNGSGAGSGGATPPMNAPFAGGGAGGPMMGGDPMAALTPTPGMDKKIAALQSGTDKKALAAAYADRGFARMNDQNAGPRVKYRKALEDYRVALQNDPTNAKARENKDMIEKIYRDMGRPIPGEETTGGKK